MLSFTILMSLSLKTKILYEIQLLKKLKSCISKNNIIAKHEKFNSKTSPNDWGNNSVFYLDLHNLN